MQDKLKTQIQKAVKSIVEGTSSIYKNENLFGKGVVMCAGGKNLFTSALVTIKLLRQTGCTLPIQWFYADEQEMPLTAIRYLKDNFQITCINLDEIQAFKGLNKRGFQIKAMAISASSFEEVLFIDADNLPVLDPSPLFDSFEYQSTGAIFWPDLCQFGMESTINTQKHTLCCSLLNLDTPLYGESEFESGQLLINKTKHQIPLQLCLFMNLNSNIFYKLLWGDKDTFRYAWKKAEAGFYVITPKPAVIGNFNLSKNQFKGMGLVQYNFQQLPLWLHMNLIPWHEWKQEPWNYWVTQYEYAQFYPYKDRLGYYGFRDKKINLIPVPLKLKLTFEQGEFFWKKILQTNEHLLKQFTSH